MTGNCTHHILFFLYADLSKLLLLLQNFQLILSTLPKVKCQIEQMPQLKIEQFQHKIHYYSFMPAISVMVELIFCL